MVGAVTAAGHGIAGAGVPPPEETNGHDQVVMVLEVAPLPAESTENVGRDPTARHKGKSVNHAHDPLGAIARNHRYA